jgi:AcrR family transcriptional regulator
MKSDQRSEAGSADHTPASPLVHTAADLFALKGYSATSTRELSDALGMTKGTFYHHFPSKEELLVQICRESLTRATDSALSVLAEARSSSERLESLVRQHVLTMLADQALHTTMLIELRSLSPANYEAVVALRDAYNQIIYDAISQCQADGTLAADIDAHLVTLLLLNLLNWTIFWYRPTGEHTPSEIADSTIRMFLEGFGQTRGLT